MPRRRGLAWAVLDLVGAMNPGKLSFFRVSECIVVLLVRSFISDLTSPATGRFLFAEDPIGAIGDAMLTLGVKSSGIELFNFLQKLNT